MDINSISPNLRDFLLNRNIISNTVKNNGLLGLLHGIGQPVEIENLPISIKPSIDLNTIGQQYKKIQILNNQYIGSNTDYEIINIINKSNVNANIVSNTSIYSNSNNNNLLYKTEHLQANGTFQGGDIRKFTTTKNLYLDKSKQEIINLNTQTSISKQHTSYLDENNKLNVGGPSTQPLDIIGTVLNGQALGVAKAGLVTSFDIRTTLAGRTLGGVGGINDTNLGIIAGQQLAFALANNAAFGLQQETIGHINTNPLSLMKGNGIIIPNYSITVPQGKLGKAVDFLDKVLGFEVPVSLMGVSSSIYTSENPIPNISRANQMIANTGKGQVLALFANINSNKYKPSFSDERVKQGINKAADGSNPSLYAFDDGKGGVIDFINDVVGADGTKINSPVSQSNYNNEGLIAGSGFDGLGNIETYTSDGNKSKFSWGDDKFNKDAKIAFPEYNSFFQNKKTLLSKTKELFNTNKMKNLVSGHGVEANGDEISTTQRGFMSKGSGVISNAALTSSFENPKDVFCRTWTTFERYNQVKDLQKNRGLYGQGFSYRNGSENSVLGDNGFVRIGPYKDDGNDVRNYMFSLENLAWNDNLANLLDSEIGQGDGNTKGRIMWFPPYDLVVSENNSSNWDNINFIGRGEPIYNYNNAERSGTLSFKVIVDHPSYMNAFKNEDNDYIASFFAGCTDMDPLISSRLTTTEIQEIQQTNITKPQQKDIPPQTPPPDFSIYFPNDATAIPTLYENGINSTTTSPIDYSSNPNGNKLGLGTTTGDGYTSPNGTSFPDNTNFGLNGKNYQGQVIVMDGVSYSGWVDTNFQIALSVYLTDKCPLCRINLGGYASQQGTTSANQELSDARAANVKAWFIANIIPNDKLGEKRFEKVAGKGTTGTDCTGTGAQDRLGCKINRKVDISFIFDPSLSKDAKPDETVKNEENPNVKVNQKIINRFYDESKYFEKLRQEDSFVFDKIRDKIKYFHPSFHSTTPEGLNSRLNFLLQCTRQGPTINGDNADNLAFGRPPVCILRLGDFYHSKIAIDNVNISYDPLVWDLNPEGIGVQPMIANVDLSFKFIGGQSLYGPINKLQNAVSFNFFANTHVYDVRADKLKKNDTPDNGPNLILVDGQQVSPPVVKVINESNIEGNGSSNTIIPTNQESVANKQNNQVTSTNTDAKIIGFNLGTVSSASTNWYIVFSLNTENITTDAQRTTFINKGIKIKIVRNSNVSEIIITNLVYFNTKNSVITIPLANIPASSSACDITLLVNGKRIQSQNIILG